MLLMSLKQVKEWETSCAKACRCTRLKDLKKNYLDFNFYYVLVPSFLN